MIYYVYGKTIYEFMQKVNDAVKKGHRVVVMGVNEGFKVPLAKVNKEVL